jgi:hypothetical protein
MKNVLIRECTYNDIEAVVQLDAQWEQEHIAYNFIPISREEFIAHLQSFQTYFLVAESDGYIVGYVMALYISRERCQFSPSRSHI